LTLMLVLGVLAGPPRSAAGSSTAVTQVVLALDEQQRRRCDRRRFQSRSIRSVNAGVFTVKYETGRSDTARTHPAQLQAVAPPGMAFAYDVIAEVLHLRYVELKQREEIRVDPAMWRVPISAGSVSNLSRLGLACLEQLHEAAAPILGKSYRDQAFILHLDGTHEGGQWCHFVIREGMTGHVLLAKKIRSEHADDIAAMLKRVKKLFGCPDVIVSDMSSTIGKAVKKVFTNIPHKLCHYHFLKAVGKTILGADHDALGHGVKRTRSDLLELRRECVAHLREGAREQEQVIALIDRVNVYAGNLRGEGFPFDLPNLCYVQRCREVLEQLESLLGQRRCELAAGGKVLAHLVRLRMHLRPYAEPWGIRSTARIERRNRLFMRLRDILHPVAADTRAPLNWGRIDDPSSVADIAGKLAEISDEASRMARRKSLSTGEAKMWRSLHKQLKNHGNKLAPVLMVRGQFFVLPRTNNLSETGFRDLKRKQRRTTGNGNLKRQLDHMPAQVFYVENLTSASYRQCVFGDRPMYECFADADWQAVKDAAETMTTPARLGAVDHALINRDDFFAAVTATLAAAKPAAA